MSTPDRRRAGQPADRRAEYAEDLTNLVTRLHEASSVAETEQRLVENAVRLVGGDRAALCVLKGRMGVETTAVTDEGLRTLQSSAAAPHSGPEVAVLDGDPMVVVNETELELRWREWADRAVQQGVRSAVSARVSTLGSALGTLNVYSAEPAHFDSEAVTRLRLLAAQAGVALVGAQQRENLWQAVDARKLIGQAQGMLMERYRLDTDQAFAVLLRYSQDKNLKLRSVAEHLVSTRQLPA